MLARIIATLSESAMFKPSGKGDAQQRLFYYFSSQGAKYPSLYH
jgi:hypothetical protein